EGTLNPGWFGHPGSTTIYLLALIDIIVVGGGLLTGAYPDLHTMTAAAYADPALLFVPARLAMVLLGLLSIWLIYVLGARVADRQVGLVAATLLALNPLHIAWSQVVRTDIHASVFMLASLIFAVRSAVNDRTRDWILAGVFAGFATATKWPAASVMVAIAGAALVREGKSSHGFGRLLLAAAAAVGGVFVASPYILLDWRTVLRNVSGEMSAGHLGHTGGGFLHNLGWYCQEQVAGTMGWLGLVAVLAGLLLLLARSKVARATIIPAAAAFLILICGQNLIWSRWILPVMPLLCIFAAVAVVWAATRLAGMMKSTRPALALVAVAAIACVPSALGAYAQARERGNDTRTQAAKWARAHIPSGSSVVIEHLELSLRDQPWTILFPLGTAGCVDAKQLLSSKVGYKEVQGSRRGSQIVDIGNVDPARAASCRADYAILTYYDLYQQERDRYPAQVGTYERVLAGGRTVALFVPETGLSGGPIVRIVATRQQ
ncbi:MAG: ArnT family glycosyltransferase, partial [Sphingomicrobium sp.]